MKGVKLVVLGLILTLLIVPSKAQGVVITWESYSDPSYTIQSDYFSQSDCFVYMKAVGLPPVGREYSAKYYDASDTLLQVMTGLSQQGIFTSIIQPSKFPNSVAGVWKVELHKLSPSKLEATDTFTVEPSAIPEFPVVFSSIGVAGLCALIYLWRRKKRRIQLSS